MKKTLTAILLGGVLLATAVQAQPPYGGQISAQQMEMMKKLQNMSPQEQAAFAQQMQQQAAQASECFSKVDESEMQKLQTKGEAIQAKVQKMCADGDRSGAQSYAMSEGMKMMNDPTIATLRDCSQDMVKSMPFLQAQVAGVAEAGKEKHICD